MFWLFCKDEQYVCLILILEDKLGKKTQLKLLIKIKQSAKANFIKKVQKYLISFHVTKGGLNYVSIAIFPFIFPSKFQSSYLLLACIWR